MVTSFENRVRGQALLLVDREAGDVDWDKEMVMPASDCEEALERLGQVGNALVGIQNNLAPSDYQRLMEQTGQEMEAFAVYEQRLALGCATGCLAVETAVKSLIHLSAMAEARPRGHDIGKLLPQLPEPHRSETEKRLAPVGVESLQRWQQQARYERLVTPTDDVFRGIALAACSVALYAANQFPPGLGAANPVRKKVSYIEQVIAHRDLYTGQDREQREGPTPP